MILKTKVADAECRIILLRVASSKAKQRILHVFGPERFGWYQQQAKESWKVEIQSEAQRGFN